MYIPFFVLHDIKHNAVRYMYVVNYNIINYVYSRNYKYTFLLVKCTALYYGSALTLITLRSVIYTIIQALLTSTRS